MKRYTMLDIPQRFLGSPEQRRENFETHHFITNLDGDVRCVVCDCRPGGVHADWPCGDDVPRELVAYNLPAPKSA
jgi:hypothetical protein